VIEHLFSYGTLRDAPVQRAVFGRTITGTPDAITGYRLRPITISSQDAAAISGTDAHTILEPGDGPSIEGTVFAISADDLASCDAYESAEYTRIKVRLRLGIDAWVYVRA
jgi:gamma-glutamylcyclotransferase (GGCT)/AIG2-like uncharacterized protein YtfP